MAQTAPPLPAPGAPRPLPRGGRGAAKNTRPRFQAVDAVWMVLLAALFVGLAVWNRPPNGGQWADVATGAGTVLLTYLLGWRASGRAAGVIGALLLATSAPFVSAIHDSLFPDLFALLTVGALFAFVAGSSLAALGLAAVATVFRWDGLLLGLILLTLSLVQHRRRAAWGTLLFLSLAAGAVFAGIQLHTLSSPVLDFHPTLPHFLMSPTFAFLTWFLLPFCAEMGDSVRRARWLPIVLWALVFPAANCFWQFGASSLPFLPVLFALIAGGLARLLPVLAGEFPIPALRYVIATLAVVWLVGLRAWQEWPLRHSSASVPPRLVAPPAPAPILMPPSPPVVTKAPERVAPMPSIPTKPAATPKPVTVHKPAVPAMPPAKASAPAKPAVTLYHVVNGHIVRRSKWAVQWDLTHPHP